MTAIPGEVQDWIIAGRYDIGLFAWRGFGVKLHAAQILAGTNIAARIAAFILLWWANRCGKTTLLVIVHLHSLFYKIGMEPPRDELDYRQRWLPASYRTLHCAPLNRLTSRAYDETAEILRGMSEAQWDEETHTHRDAPLAPFFRLAKERNVTGSDDIVLHCENGAACDFFSTEGGAARLEGSAWWVITWDEYPATEGDTENIRLVLNRLTSRAADHGATIVLTGTITENSEMLVKEWIVRCEDPSDPDWWGCGAERMLNTRTSAAVIERERRSKSPEDFARTVMGRPGGMKGRMIPDYLLANAFNNDLPDRTAPVEGDGTTYDPNLKRRVDIGKSPYTYLTLVDTAISEADNVISVFRLPRDMAFSVEKFKDALGVDHGGPIEGVCCKIVPGSRTLTDDEIVLTIEETFLLYGGQVWIDTTDAHGKNIARTLRNHGIPARDFDFHDRNTRGDTWKEAGIIALRKLLAEQQMPTLEQSLAGEHEQDVPTIDRSKPYGVIRIPKTWTKHRDQLSILRPPPGDLKQKKDAAMTDVMLAAVAQRQRPRGPVTHQRLVVFGGR